MSLTTIKNLPLELASAICEKLSRLDLRAVRFLNHVFASAGQRILFRDVYVYAYSP